MQGLTRTRGQRQCGKAVDKDRPAIANPVFGVKTVGKATRIVRESGAAANGRPTCQVSPFDGQYTAGLDKDVTPRTKTATTAAAAARAARGNVDLQIWIPVEIDPGR